jgi:Mg2+/Co2+ transporter CorB
MTSLLIGLLVGVFLAGAGFITLLETAFITISLPDILYMQRQENKQALIIHGLLQKQDRVVSSFHVGYLLFVISAVILMTHSLFMGSVLWHLVVYDVIAVIFIAVMTRALPRSYVLKQEQSFKFMMASSMRAVYYLFSPIAMMVAWINRKIAVFYKYGFYPANTLFGTSDYQGFVSRYFEEAIVQEKPGQMNYMIQRSLTKFADLRVNDLMIPVANLKRIDAALPAEELMATVFDSNEKRVLLYQDSPENIEAVLHTQLLMRSFCLAEGDKDTTDITSAISEPIYIQSGTSIFDQLQNFSRNHEQFALIKDTKGIVIGAIAMDTILETLSKELRQENAA